MVKHALLLVTLALLSGCYYLQKPTAPMEQAYYPAQNGYQLRAQAPAHRQRDLLIMLPGMGDSIDRFTREGLIAQVAHVDLPLDVVVVNAHFNYYRSRTLLERLHQDVLLPAQALGYRRVHLAGVSLGGFGALLYWREFAGADPGGPELGAVLLLTPYLGEPEYYQHHINPGAAAKARGEEKNLWPWLDSQQPAARQHWYMGMAREDDFFRANQLLAERLPAANSATVNGGHNWQSWRELWPQLLANLKRDFYSKVQNYE
ncbi:hypothetical protein [Gilvimarinus sp. DA14]|uniref:hypothetical protein n=1 Tax=Gilvimarinus sp. DA14 TaxID=2956798 RepID=UPI0020B6D56A|nr:hypothetical protein [Gilvimarinus sp. DA14]UTF61298.1 hypothetical protein NHM04_05720 [Gilvimarinus sp. DA14]